MIKNSFIRRYYPDSSRDGTVYFYQLIRSEASEGIKILNLGAGPGDLCEGKKISSRDLRSTGIRIFCCDPDPVVLTNPQCDEAAVMKMGRIPFDDSFFHLVYSDYVLEHVEDPLAFLSEVRRVLGRGGSFFFRTPNLRHYIAAIAYITPDWFPQLVANRARGLRSKHHPPYPTFFRMNTPRRLRSLFDSAGFESPCITMFEGAPSYLVFSRLTFICGVLYERTVNRFDRLSSIRSNMIGFAKV